jgi:hypothetical protein
MQVVPEKHVEPRSQNRMAPPNVQQQEWPPAEEQKEPPCESKPTQSADATPLKSSGQKTQGPVSKVGGWLTAISLAGVLAGAGFIARFSQEQFLGISLGDWSVQDLSLLAGRCGIDSMLLPVAFLLRHIVVLALCVAVFLISAVLVARFGERPKVEMAFRACGLVALFSATCAVLLRYEAPTIQLHDWLTIGTPSLETIPGSPTFKLIVGPNSYINARYSYVSKLLIASKLPRLDPIAAELPISGGNAKVPILFGFGTKPADAGDYIQAQYSIAILVCLGSWIYLSITPGPERSTLSERILYCGELVVLGLLVVVSVLIPYMYGKLISSTEFPVVDISYKEPAPNSNSDADKVWSDEVPLIATTDKDVSVLSIQHGIAKVIHIPRDRLLYLHVYGKKDVLEELLEQRALASASATPP